MNDDQREQVLANAQYLQHVRPVDPAEICEYVDGRPPPATVREVLRDEALALGFVEREDGAFEPASTAPIDGDHGPFEAFPQHYASILLSLLSEAFGPDWSDGRSGDELRARVRDVKERYHRQKRVSYDYQTALAYAIYHLPQTYAATRYVLGDLAVDGEIPGQLRVLDVGAGVGGPALALADLAAADALVDYHAVEPSDAADVLDAVLDATGPNVHPTIHRTRVESFEPDPDYDLILCSNVFSELAAPVDVATRLLGGLAPHGTLVAIAPADRVTATGLRKIERDLERDAGPTVYAPTVRLWPGHRPESDSWSFDVKPDLVVPAFQRQLDEGVRADPPSDDAPGSGEFCNVDVQFSFSLLRVDGRTRIAFTPDSTNMAKMATMDRHVTDRVDCVAIKLSHNLADGPAANPLYLIGDGSQRIDHFAVCTNETSLNEALRQADYGELLRLENVLVLWNDDEGAYNLVVDDTTIVDRHPL